MSTHKNPDCRPKKATNPRRTQVQRSEGTRAALSKAAYEIVADRGFGGLRLAAVSERAGVSQGALLHHYSGKDALVIAAIRHALQQAKDKSEKNLQNLPDQPDLLLRLMLDDLSSFFRGDWFWVSLGITIDASRESQLHLDIAEVTNELRLPVYHKWELALEGIGFHPDDAKRIQREAACLIAGDAVRKLWANPDQLMATIEANWILAKLAELKRYR